MLKKLFAAARAAVLFLCADTVAHAANGPVTFQIDRSLTPSPVCVLRLTSGPCATIGFIDGNNIWTPAGPGGIAIPPSAYIDTTDASNISRGTLPGARLPPPAPAVKGGVFSGSAPDNQVQTGIGADGYPIFAQRSFAILSDKISSAQVPSGLSVNSPILTGGPSTPSLNGFLYSSAGSGAWSASPTISATFLVDTIAPARLPNLGGDVDCVQGDCLIPVGSLGNDKLANAPAATVKCNPGTSGGPPQDCAYGVVAPQVRVRQTVLSGNRSNPKNGPTFLGTSSGLSIPLSGNLVVTAAQGFDRYGAIDAVGQIASGATWTLADNATNYLYANAKDGTLGATTLKPNYVSVGGPSSDTTAGQFTFDRGNMTGYMGNGTTAPATPIVIVGEVDTSGGAVTATRPYGYRGVCDSGLQSNFPASNSGTTYDATYGCALGVDDVDVQVKVIVTAAAGAAGYSLGDVVSVGTGTNYPMQTWSSRTTVGFTVGGNVFQVLNKTTGAVSNIGGANWGYRATARRTWGGS